MEYKKEITIGLSVLIAVGFVAYFYFNPVKPPLVEQVPVTSIITPEASTNPEPVKTDFENENPTDFPTNIPVEQGVKVNQSYSLDYAGQKQLSIVFPSVKTIKQNYTLYADFLNKDGWVVVNKYESATVSSMYGAKGNNDINITINEGASVTPAKSQVSISVLTK